MENGDATPDGKSVPRPVADARPDTALAPAHMARVFHQPSLIYFNAVARHLSMREAARQLNVASSAISRQIGQLETALGLTLFERDRQRLHLTPSGEVLYRHTRLLATTFDTALAEIEMLRGLRTGRVRIATVESVGLSFLPQFLAEFGQRHPRIHLDIIVTSSADVLDKLLNDEVDIGFGFIHEQPKGLEIALRRDVRVGALMKPDHPLASGKILRLNDCLSYPIAIARPEISLRGVIDPFLEQAGPSLPPIVEANSIRMLVQLALAGHYVSIMTPIGAQTELTKGQLCFRPLEDPGLPTNRFALLVRTRSSLHFAPAVFYEFAMERFASIELPGAV
ncbi:LysR family transcriptional regulator [Chachezhania antarctica]|uniref:LysR family transcriptional regulator n=1 Tax=Chachezhania antarctica TaxID=2340860 RepID=UPI000EAEB9AA|nr:LysR family transcriptional regulator [Chachezhania antarctica]